MSKNYQEKIMKLEKGTPKEPNSQEKRPYIRPGLKKFGCLKDMTAAGGSGLTADGVYGPDQE